MSNPLKTDPLLRQAVRDLRETLRTPSNLSQYVRSLTPRPSLRPGSFIPDRIHRLTSKGWTVEEVKKHEDPSHDDR